MAGTRKPISFQINFPDQPLIGQDSIPHELYAEIQRIYDAIWQVAANAGGGGGGAGTVTSFSFTDTAYITGIVTNPATTPNLTLTLVSIPAALREPWQHRICGGI